MNKLVGNEEDKKFKLYNYNKCKFNFTYYTLSYSK